MTEPETTDLRSELQRSRLGIQTAITDGNSNLVKIVEHFDLALSRANLLDWGSTSSVLEAIATYESLDKWPPDQALGSRANLQTVFLDLLIQEMAQFVARFDGLPISAMLFDRADRLSCVISTLAASIGEIHKDQT